MYILSYVRIDVREFTGILCIFRFILSLANSLISSGFFFIQNYGVSTLEIMLKYLSTLCKVGVSTDFLKTIGPEKLSIF